MPRPRFERRTAALALLAASGLAGCNPELTSEGRAGCAYGTASVSDGDENMLPGTACKTCHDDFVLAGTVFPTAASPCAGEGIAGVKVEILDDRGNVALALESDGGGNFFADRGLPSPYTARITGLDGTVQRMATRQTEGSCAHCHREPAAFGTTGRIYVDGTVGSENGTGGRD